MKDRIVYETNECVLWFFTFYLFLLSNTPGAEVIKPSAKALQLWVISRCLRMGNFSVRHKTFLLNSEPKEKEK